MIVDNTLNQDFNFSTCYFFPNNLALITRVSLKIKRSFGFNKSINSVNFLSLNDFVFLFKTRSRLESLFEEGFGQ